MKKVFSFIMGLVAMTSLYAANTEVARLTLTGQGGAENSYITLRVDPTVTTAQTGAYFENTDLDGNVNIYIKDGANKYSSYKKDDLTNLPLEVITNRRAAANQHYTIAFNVPTSTVGLKLKDLKTGDNVDIVNNGTYEFDVNTTLHPDYVEGTNYVIKDRFVINYTYVIMKGDFTDPSWAYTSNFTHDGATASLDLTLDADTWYHFQIEENGAVGANGSAFDKDHKSYVVPATGWVEQLTLHTDAAGTYTFTWTYASDNLSISFPAPATGYDVTPNASGWATFSAAEATVIPAGATVYRGVISGEELRLYAIEDYVPANTGVIVSGASALHFDLATTSVPALTEDNDLKPSASYSTSMENVFVLKGENFLKYVGTEALAANKAFLQLSAQSGAPQRIRMVINGAQGVENAAEEVKTVKFIENGQIYIRRGQQVYDLQGQIVK